MSYKRGVTISEDSTSLAALVTTTAGLPVFVGTAPIHLAASQDYVNKPLLAYNKAEAVAGMGYSSDWSKYTLSEAIKSQFDLYNVAPIVLINVLDPAKHKKSSSSASVNIVNGAATVDRDGVLLKSLVVKLTAGGAALAKDTDYTVAFNADGKPVITRLATGTIPANQTTLDVAYDYLDASMVTKTDVIGGVNATTGAYSGLELVNRVFPLFRFVPGQILAPGWSHLPEVAAVIKAKASNINGLFKATPLLDVDSSAAGADLYTKVPAWKQNNNYTDPQEIVCWPKVKNGDDVYRFSTQMAGVICQTDAANEDIPYVSPSNRALQATAAVIDDGTEVALGPDQAAYLNGEGVVTALNFIGGWRTFGSRTGAYPGNTDVKDSFIPVRRMFNWVGNQIILSYWQKVDNPTNRRMIDSVVDSLNIWLNGLTARGALLGGKVSFLPEENPSTDLINGIVRFRIKLTPPVPAESIEATLEFDVSNLTALFAA